MFAFKCSILLTPTIIASVQREEGYYRGRLVTEALTIVLGIDGRVMVEPPEGSTYETDHTHSITLVQSTPHTLHTSEHTLTPETIPVPEHTHTHTQSMIIQSLK